MPDPADFVDRFESLVQKWKQKVEFWEGDSDLGRFTDPYRNREWSLIVVKELSDMLETQVQVNAMTLAAIDDLKQRLDNQEQGD